VIPAGRNVDASALVSRITTLPTPGAVLQTIMATVESPDLNLDKLTNVVRHDPALAGRILRAANGHSGDFPLRISSINNAVSFLGCNRVRSLLLLSNRLAGESPSPLPSFFTLERFWQHSVLVALIAGSIGRHLQRYDAPDEEELFTGGLLHDIGKLALAAGGGGNLEAARLRSISESLPFYRAEHESPHTLVGALLMQEWRLPPELHKAAGGHHDPALGGNRLVAVIHIADVMAHLMGYPVFPEETYPPVDVAALAALPLPPERLKLIAGDAIVKLRELEHFYGLTGLDTGAPPEALSLVSPPK